jgi:hypothetical protein
MLDVDEVEIFINGTRLGVPYLVLIQIETQLMKLV